MQLLYFCCAKTLDKMHFVKQLLAGFLLLVLLAQADAQQRPRLVGRFISSDYYSDTLSAWVNEFNNRQLPDQYVEEGWSLLLPRPKKKAHLSAGPTGGKGNFPTPGGSYPRRKGSFPIAFRVCGQAWWLLYSPALCPSKYGDTVPSPRKLSPIFSLPLHGLRIEKDTRNHETMPPAARFPFRGAILPSQE